VGALLTIAGYSINDTIVIFDRIRESLKTEGGEVKTLMNDAINATLSRTILTSLTTIVTVAILSIFGGSALKDFSTMILIGLVIGTYSSVFIASPVVLWWSNRKGGNLRKEVLTKPLVESDVQVLP
jgi:SecD/SecF fusion protein